MSVNLKSLLSSHTLGDEFTRLRRELEAREPRPRHIVVFGASGKEGASTVAAHLALAFAGGQPAGGRVLLVQANLHKRVLRDESGLPFEGPGLWGWDMNSPLPSQPFARQPALHLLGPGSPPKDRMGLASASDRLLAALAQADREDYAYTIWDVPALLQHAEGIDLIAASDGGLAVIEMDETRVGALEYLRGVLDRRHARLLGAVLNRCGRYWPRSTRRLAV
ncbi:hypothetical protein JI742_01805 [Piscinibacter sp. Jin2]|uniref:CpsD/CapB family tyrosine-protein kinase n=1 Tax=Aquariibacter lacus TaxID=2801332 RepID=A0A9X0XCU4_9BURK|nr:hypothetical protein [Piscinibacter lacus]MBL0718613.1 hypothetical protein [Piscinibacter lacus]